MFRMPAFADLELDDHHNFRTYRQGAKLPAQLTTTLLVPVGDDGEPDGSYRYHLEGAEPLYRSFAM